MTTFTFIHVLISVVAILSGFVVLIGFLTAKRLDGWTAFFLATTAATSVTGFLLPLRGVTPAVVTGIVSLAVLALAIYARYARDLGGGWRKTYVVSTVFVLYANVFVLIVQAFQKIPALKDIAPTQNEPPFKLTQLAVLIAFIAVGVFAIIRFRVETVPLTMAATPTATAARR